MDEAAAGVGLTRTRVDRVDVVGVLAEAWVERGDVDGGAGAQHEALLGSSITQVILYPSDENPITVMMGVQTGAPSVRGRKPTAGKVLLQYLGTRAGWARGDPPLRQVPG